MLFGVFCGALPQTPQGSGFPLTPCWRGDRKFSKQTTLSLAMVQTRGVLGQLRHLLESYDTREKCTQRIHAIRCNRPVVGQPQGTAPTFCGHTMAEFRINSFSDVFFCFDTCLPSRGLA